MIKNVKLFAGVVITVSILASTLTFYFWQVANSPNLNVQGAEKINLYVPTGATYRQVLDSLKAKKAIHEPASFALLAKWMKVKDMKMKPGRYIIKPNMGNRPFLVKLRNGEQDPIKLTFNNVRLKEDLISKIGNKFEFKGGDLSKLIKDPAYCQQLGFDTTTVMAMFLPDTYFVDWNTTPEALLARMKAEYNKFWTDERLSKAKQMNMSPIEVSVMASIVQGETNKIDERPRVAGAYLNRLKINMPLQADPTVVFAWRDFGIRRVTERHTALASPYNTYRNTGLPPGPINLPEPNAIDAVLNPENHNYLYFCAKEDFSGYHNFAADYEQHMRNARIYQDALNKRGIR
jgi:UPF0755 protein